MPNYAEPHASKITLPQGYETPGEDGVLLPWNHARERLEQAQNYWICTASLSGKPHAMPLWGVWLDDLLYFDGHPATRWGRNIAANPQITMHLENGTEVVIVEGIVEDVNEPGPTRYRRVADAFDAKYNYQLPDHDFFVLHPRVAFVWSLFPKDATRWQFGES
jgi:hypothetical protein